MACHECGELESPRLSLASRRNSPTCYAVRWSTALATLGWGSDRSSDGAVFIALWSWASNSFSPVHLPLSHGRSVSSREKMDSIEELISPAFSVPSVSSEMVSWKGHRPESRAGWRASGLTPDTLATSYMPAPGLSFLTSEMGVALLPHGLAGRVCGMGRAGTVGTAKAEWPWVRHVCFGHKPPVSWEGSKGTHYILPHVGTSSSALEAYEPGWQEQVALIGTSTRGTRSYLLEEWSWGLWGPGQP